MIDSAEPDRDSITVDRISTDSDGAERTSHAVTFIRETMLMRTLGNIDHAKHYRVFSILAFAMPEPDAATLF